MINDDEDIDLFHDSRSFETSNFPLPIFIWRMTRVYRPFVDQQKGAPYMLAITRTAGAHRQVTRYIGTEQSSQADIIDFRYRMEDS